MADVLIPNQQILMELEPFDEMSSQLGAAPLAINVLGLLCLSTTKRDFDLRCDEWDNFELLQFPGSFRACLCQAVRSGCEAFQKVDSTMEAIRLHTGRVPNLLKTVLKLLYHPQATRKDLETYLPTNLNEIQKVADECIIEAEGVKEGFNNVIGLLSELQTATLYKQGKVEDAKRLTQDRIEWEKKTKEELENQKKDMEIEIEELKQEYEEYKEKFNKSVNEMPGVWSLAIRGLVDGVKTVLSSLSMMPSVEAKSDDVEAIEPGYNDQEIPTEKFIKIDGKPISANPDVLRSYLLDISGLENAYQQLSSLFQTDGKSETISCEKDPSEVIACVKEELGHRKYQLGKKESGQPISEKLVKTITTTLKLTEELERNQHNAEKVKQINIEIEKYGKEIADLTLCIKSICKVPQIRRSKMTVTQSSSSIVANLVEGAYRKVEMTRIAMVDTIKQENETSKRRIQTMNDMNECIIQINNFKCEKEQQESILAVISKGIDAFKDFQNQWSQLIQFFAEMAIFIKCSMSKEMNKFVKDANDTYQNGNTTSEIGREIVYLAASQAVKTASYVRHLSEVYCSISRKHLVPLNNKLHHLLSLSSENNEEARQQRLQFEGDCLAVVGEIKDIIHEKHQEFKQTLKLSVKSLYEGLQATAPITQDEQDRMASITLQMNNRAIISQESSADINDSD